MRWTAITLFVSMTCLTQAQAQVSCPRPGTNQHLVFNDGSLAMRTALEVNPDGAGASYTPGDHGYTYISNGVNLIDKGRKVSCSAKGNSSRCRAEWAKAEAGDFAQGTPEFCVFAMEVEPVQAGSSRVRCELPRRGRYVIGNGKGRPKPGKSVPTVTGQSVTAYLSTTTLRHTVNGRESYVDSAVVPALVVPTSRPELVGAIAWVRYGANSGFAIVGDTGPAFGEGSVALHQLLVHGEIGPEQPVGPIPLEQRCSSVETDLKAPFQSRPDIARGDECRPGRSPRSAADIRAYRGIARDVDSVILSEVKPPMDGSLVTVELNLDLLEDTAAAAGFTSAKLAQMADCLGN